jgi:hypothetical protein
VAQCVGPLAIRALALLLLFLDELEARDHPLGRLAVRCAVDLLGDAIGDEALFSSIVDPEVVSDEEVRHWCRLHSSLRTIGFNNADLSSFFEQGADRFIDIGPVRGDLTDAVTCDPVPFFGELLDLADWDRRTLEIDVPAVLCFLHEVDHAGSTPEA